MGKKKRSEVEVEVEVEAENESLCRSQADDEPVTNGDGGGSEKTKKKKKKKKTQDVEDKENRKADSEKIIPTVAIAIPASIIDNAQSLELATRLAGQIARAATIYRVNEIVVFDNNGKSVEDPSASSIGNTDENESSAAFFIRILRYLETPQYLRKTLFPRHNSLRFVGLLPPLDAPHHLRKHEWGSYREGVTLRERPPNSVGTLVDVGLSKNVVIDQELGPGIRVTVVMGTDRNLSCGICHQIVPSTRPQEGVYWGYKVRYAPNLSSVIENCPFEGGYDHVIGTSEHGQVVKSTELSLPAFREGMHRQCSIHI